MRVGWRRGSYSHTAVVYSFSPAILLRVAPSAFATAMVMNSENRALCYFYRHPPPGFGAPMKWSAIAQRVWNADGRTHPTAAGVRQCVLSWTAERRKRGRKAGWRKTTNAEDRQIAKSFHKARLPLGSRVTSRDVELRLSTGLRRKISKRTIRRRLANLGYIPARKKEKTAFLDRQRKVRIQFCKAHEHRSEAMWANYLQGCGDLKDFTYYPRKMKARFARFRCSWTYMKHCERSKAEFLKPKPKEMFPKKEYKKNVKKGKVLGFTTSTGRKLFVLCPQDGWDSPAFARLIRRRVGPFFKAAFPDKERIRVLLDSEALLHAPPAKAAMAEFGIEVMPDWPKYSPDLNPQENVWGWAERMLRQEEERSDSFPDFCRRVLRVARRYPADNLIPSMHHRIKAVLKAKGAMTKY